MQSHVRFVDQWDNAIEMGANVAVVTSGAGTLQSDDCQSLAGMDSVLHVGQVSVLDEATFDSAPGDSVRTATVDVGYLRIVAPDFRGSTEGVVVGMDAAGTFGARTGSILRTQTGEIDVVGVLAESPRASDRARWAMIPWHADNFGPVAECWFESEPDSSGTAIQLASSYFPESPELRIVRAYDADFAAIRTVWDQRATAYFPLIVGALAALVYFSVLMTSRQSVALYRVLGATRKDTTIIWTSTGLAILGTAQLASLCVVGWAAALDPSVRPESFVVALASSVSSFGVSIALLPVACWIGSRVHVADVLRSRAS